MKATLQLLLFLLFSLPLLGQQDTVFLSMESVSAPAGESVCSKMTAQGFDDIVSVQLIYQWDETLLELDTILPTGLNEWRQFAYSNPASGVAMVTWHTVVGVTLAEGEPIIELCFTSLTDAALAAAIRIGPSDKIETLATNQLEIVTGELKTTVIVTEDGIFNALPIQEDCDAALNCLSGMAVNYEGESIDIWREDVVATTINEFASCQRVAVEDVLLINLSAANPVPAEYVRLSCGNLRDTIYLGLALRTAGTDEYWVSCIIPVAVLGDISEDCKMTDASWSDPSICNDVSSTATRSETTISHQQLLSLSSTPPNDYNYIEQSLGWTYSSIGEMPITLDCTTYDSLLSIKTILIIAPPIPTPESIQIVVPEWCEHGIEITAAPGLCDPTIVPGDVELSIANLSITSDVSLSLNGEKLLPLTNGNYVLSSDDLLSTDNEITIEGSPSAIASEVTTLDLVAVMKALREEASLIGRYAVGADADRSGSVTTKDLLAIWEYILGIQEWPANPFYIGDDEELTAVTDFLRFENTFDTYRFDKDEVSFDEELELTLGLVGDAFNSKSNSSKSNDVIQLIYTDELISAGEAKVVQLQIINAHTSPLIGLFFGLQNDERIVKEVEANMSSAFTLSNDATSDYRFSYLNIDNEVPLSVQVSLTTDRDSRISDLLSLSDFMAEAIADDGSVYNISLQRQSPQEGLQVYPNPTDTDVTVTVSDQYLGGRIQIVNTAGSVVGVERITVTTMVLDDDYFTSGGLYMLRVSNDESVEVARVTVHR